MEVCTHVAILLGYRYTVVHLDVSYLRRFASATGLLLDTAKDFEDIHTDMTYFSQGLVSSYGHVVASVWSSLSIAMLHLPRIDRHQPVAYGQPGINSCQCVRTSQRQLGALSSHLSLH